MKNTCSLKNNERFLTVYKKGRRVHHKLFVLYFIPNGLKYSRLGMKVSTKIAGAVGRNRIKRLVREVFRISKSEFVHGYDLIVVAKEGAQNVSGLSDVKKALTFLFDRAGLSKAVRL